MEKKAGSLKTKKIVQSQNPTALTKGNKMEKKAASLKTKKYPRKPKPDSLQP